MNKISYSTILQYPHKMESLVLFTVRINGNSAKVSTKQSVKTKMWDKEVHRCFTSKEKFTNRENRAATKANKILDKFENFIVTRLSSWGEQSRCLNDQAEFKEMVAHYANMFFKGIEEDEKKQNQKATEWMIANINSDRVDSHSGRYVADRTKNAQTTVIHRLQSFLADYHLEDSFKTFAEADFGDKYMKWGYEKKNYKENTIYATYEILKAQLNAAKRSGFAIDDTYYKQLRGKGKDVDNIFLTEKEIKRIYDLDIPRLKEQGEIDEKSTMEQTRDLFIIGCFTGLRRSDLNKLNDGIWNLSEDNNTVSIVAEKTKKRVVIPLHPFVRAIYEKYHGKLPKLGDKHNTNEHLKNLGRLAGIDEITSLTENRGGKVTTLKYKKYDRIGFHTARRSFATNMFLKGKPTYAIMQLTGHTNERTFYKYVKATPEQIAKLLDFNSIG